MTNISDQAPLPTPAAGLPWAFSVQLLPPPPRSLSKQICSQWGGGPAGGRQLGDTARSAKCQLL